VDTSLKALNPETTLGDIAYRSATSNTNTRLGIGTNGQVLAVSGGVPAWTTTSDVTPLTTKGDLFTFTTVDARIGIGANNTVLTADSAEATGMKWATPAASGSLPTFSAYKPTTTQTFSAATFTKITFDTESWDAPGCFASSTFTPTSAGYYSINAGLYHSQVASGDFQFVIYKNGSRWQRLIIIATTGGVAELHSGGSLVYCNGTTDYIEIYARGDTGSTVSVIEGAELTYFSGIGIRA
jgi:hypothetical protein